MARKKNTGPIQIVDGEWYAVAFGPKPWQEECCDCGLVHRVDYKLEQGRIWARYRVDQRATRRARRLRHGKTEV